MSLSDEDFLDWCERQSTAPKCRLSPSDMARLLSLAGLKSVAGLWERAAQTHRPGDPGHGFIPDDVLKSVRMARSRLRSPALPIAPQGHE